MGSKSRNDNPFSGDGASPGKIFIGGLAKDTTFPQFNKYFAKYGEIIDSVIMKDRYTGQPRGFGFITYADPSVVDKVIEEDHIINGKQVEIKRTIPKGSSHSKDFKTKKIFVGGIPSSVTEDEFRSFFSNYGKVMEHQIIRDHATNRSRGFGFIIFDSEEVVDDLLSKGNMIDMAGTQVEIKKAEPKKASNPPPAPAYGSNSRGRSYDDGFGGYGGSYGGFDGGFGPGPYRTPGSLGGRLGTGYGYGSGGGGEFGGYGGFGPSSLGGYRGESSLGYSSRFGHYVGGFAGGYGGSSVGGYGRGGDGYGSYAGSGYGGGYDSGPGASYGGAGGLYGRGGYSSSSRYHPYAR
ncbi:RNA recognition motif domain - like 10 [Theobroma cacao]|uniref:Heterogeneous nuclear ribonucleoprotein 1 n=2 Tax=Theobroma cacao TaxID=3641 RepID=A0AB32UWR4_THECC|nr:PREDICTED: heterogeneous nuclear ribonucleoprotein 1 [Theobroma cacao]EOY11959.1 RNA-binding family protein [Theobroma cacao]WRX28325.1 RNA recognition motif domain - like 10 [Theobroma cacao]